MRVELIHFLVDEFQIPDDKQIQFITGYYSFRECKNIFTRKILITLLIFSVVISRNQIIVFYFTACCHYGMPVRSVGEKVAGSLGHWGPKGTNILCVP